MSRNYSYNSNKPAFSVADDDMESAFLNSGRSSYTTGTDYTMGDSSSNIVDADEYRTTIQKLQEVEQRTLESTQRSLRAIAESEQVGVETAKDLVHQREQLENTNKRLDNMNVDLKESQKNISAIKSVFSSFKQWMATPKSAKDDAKKNGKKGSDLKSPSSDAGYQEPSFDHNPQLEKAVNMAPPPTDPSLKLRGIDYDNSSSSRRYDHNQRSPDDDWKESTKRVNQQLDNDLDEMSFGLSRLKGLAQGLNMELEGQNQLIEDINFKADKTGLKLDNTNKQINSILKKS